MANTQEKKKKNWIWTLVFVLMNVGVLLWVGLSELNRQKESGTGFSDIEVKWAFLLLVVLCFIAMVMAESGKFYSLIKRLTGKKDMATSVKVTIFGRYYDNITPSGAGGQPFQVMYLKKRGLPDGASLAIPVYAFLIQQVTFVLLAILFFIFFGYTFDYPAIRVTAGIGLIFYMLIPIAIMLSAIFPRGMARIIMWLLRALASIRLLKDPEEKGEKILSQLNEYSKAINYINRHRRLSIEMLLLSLAYHLARCSLPFLVLHSFGASVDWIAVTTATFYIYAAITIIPTPGGAGAAEASFYLIFSDLPEPGLVFWAMLVWRFFSDYIFILGGICLSGFEYLSGKIKARREKRQGAAAQ